MNEDKKVLITGASGGLGRACAVEAAKAGYYVICHYNGSKSKAEETLRLVEESGGKGELIQFNISDREDCKAKLDELTQNHGILWGIINNAGITRDNTFVGLEDDDWDKVIHTNLDSFYNVLKPLVLTMASRKNKRGGRIITMASVSGIIGNRGQTNYSASKGGIIAATKALAVELARRNIALVLENTKGLTKDKVELLSDNITISILGGLNPVKRKFAREHYQKRTYYTKREMLEILDVLEEIERLINPVWSNLEKAILGYIDAYFKTDNIITKR